MSHPFSVICSFRDKCIILYIYLYTSNYIVSILYIDHRIYGCEEYWGRKKRGFYYYYFAKNPNALMPERICIRVAIYYRVINYYYHLRDIESFTHQPSRHKYANRIINIRSYTAQKTVAGIAQ